MTASLTVLHRHWVARRRRRTLRRSDWRTIARGVRLGTDANVGSMGTRTVTWAKGHCCSGTALRRTRRHGAILTEWSNTNIAKRPSRHTRANTLRSGSNATEWIGGWLNTGIACWHTKSHEQHALDGKYGWLIRNKTTTKVSEGNTPADSVPISDAPDLMPDRSSI